MFSVLCAWPQITIQDRLFKNISNKQSSLYNTGHTSGQGLSVMSVAFKFIGHRLKCALPSKQSNRVLSSGHYFHFIWHVNYYDAFLFTGHVHCTCNHQFTMLRRVTFVHCFALKHFLQLGTCDQDSMCMA